MNAPVPGIGALRDTALPASRAAMPSVREATILMEIARREAGLHLNPAKIEFLHQRLARQLARTGCANYAAYCALLRGGRARSELRSFVEALTTHTTSFFREAPHFDWLRNGGWADLIASGAGREWTLTVWSAACSSGPELYSTLMSLTEHIEAKDISLRMEGHGTDISRRILETARTAVYDQTEIRGLDETRRRRFLMRAKDGSHRFRIVPEIRSRCTWSEANLTELGSAGPAAADVILLRNVLIYFDAEAQKQVVSSLARRLRPGGLLLTGHTETLQTPPDTLRAVASAIYRRAE